MVVFLGVTNTRRCARKWSGIQRLKQLYTKMERVLGFPNESSVIRLTFPKMFQPCISKTSNLQRCLVLSFPKWSTIWKHCKCFFLHATLSKIRIQSAYCVHYVTEVVAFCNLFLFEHLCARHSARSSSELIASQPQWNIFIELILCRTVTFQLVL